MYLSGHWFLYGKPIFYQRFLYFIKEVISLVSRLGDDGEEISSSWNEVCESFDEMGLHENLLRGIYAYGNDNKIHFLFSNHPVLFTHWCRQYFHFLVVVYLCVSAKLFMPNLGDSFSGILESSRIVWLLMHSWLELC